MDFWSNTKVNKIWFEQLHNEYNQLFDNQTIVNQVNLFTQSKNINVINLVVDKVFFYYFSLGKYNTPDIDFTKGYLDKYPLGIDNAHLGPEGNIAFAKDLYRIITGKVNYL